MDDLVEQHVDQLQLLVELIKQEMYETASTLLTQFSQEWLLSTADILLIAIDLVATEERKRGRQPS